MTVSAYVALGSNTQGAEQNLIAAIAEINALPNTNVLKTSKFYWTKFVGNDTQPDVLNGIVHTATDLPATTLLKNLLAIEQQFGRIRNKDAQQYCERTLDLDLLLYGDCVINEPPELIVPHPRMKERGFVLFPLAEIEPELVLPCGTSLQALLENLPPL